MGDRANVVGFGDRGDSCFGHHSRLFLCWFYRKGRRTPHGQYSFLRQQSQHEIVCDYSQVGVDITDAKILRILDQNHCQVGKTCRDCPKIMGKMEMCSSTMKKNKNVVHNPQKQQKVV